MKWPKKERYRYLVLRKKTTGEEIVVEVKTPSRIRRLCQGFLNKIKLEPFAYVKHITLTQKIENYKPNILNNFFNSMRRYYEKFDYLWVVEEQKRGVLHWHVMAVFYEEDIGVDDIKRIQRYWKYGNVDVKSVKKPTMGYLLKYITKSITINGSQIRKIGSSRIPGWLRQSWRYVVKAIKWFYDNGLTIKDMDAYYWYNGSAYLYEDVELKRGRLYVYRCEKDFEFLYGFNDLPF